MIFSLDLLFKNFLIRGFKLISVVIFSFASLIWLFTLAVTFYKSMADSENPSVGMKMWLQVYMVAVLPKMLVSKSLSNEVVWVARFSYLSLIVCFYSFYHAVKFITE